MQDYSLIVNTMVWSHSRLTSFMSCPYSWFLRYILGEDTSSNFYSEHGTFVHELLAKFYKGEASRDMIVIEYLTGFSHNVVSTVNAKTFDSTKAKYIDSVSNYLETFEPFKFNKIIAIEKEYKFKIDEYDFIGYVDLAGYDEAGDLLIIDNKSANLKPRSKKGKQTLTDDELDEYLRQLYLYSIPVFNETGEYPKWLIFNCFKSGVVIKEPFIMADFEKAKRWAKNIIEFIKAERNWNATGDFIYCKDLCNNRKICEYIN